VGRAAALLGEILIDSGRPPESVEVLEDAVDAFPEGGDDETRAVLLSNLSRAYMRSGAPARSIETADRALEIAERRHLERIIAETFNNKGSSLGYLGREREATALLRAAVDLAHAGGFVAAEIRALSNLAASMDADPRRGRETLDVAVSLARRVGIRSLANWAAISRLYTIYETAEGWEEALAEAEQDLADARAHTVLSPLDEIRSLSLQGLLRVARGEPSDEALASLEALAGQTTDAFGPAAVHVMRGDRALLAGEHAEACREYLFAADEPNIGEIFLARSMRAVLWGGDVVTAREIADRLDAHPSAASNISAARIAARAGIAALEGRPDEALAGYRDALSRYRAMGLAFDLACADLDLVVLIGGDDPATREAAVEARAIFDRAGARPYLERLEAATGKPTASLPSVHA
jgi:tetratricopeptide (TPR) repeat protein